MINLSQERTVFESIKIIYLLTHLQKMTVNVTDQELRILLTSLLKAYIFVIGQYTLMSWYSCDYRHEQY